MSVNVGTEITSDNLFVLLDANNAKSYPGSGTVWTDITRNGVNGTLVNGPTYSSGSIVFDGVDDVVTLPNTNYPSSWSDPLSLEVWINVPAAATWSNGVNVGNIIVRGSYVGHIGIGRGSTNNTVVFSVRGDVAQSFPVATIGRDAWYQVVGTWDGSIATIYVNGVSVQAATATTHTGVPESITWRIGDNTGFGGASGNFFNGSISNIKMYKKSLSAAEVRDNFNALRGRFGL